MIRSFLRSLTKHPFFKRSSLSLVIAITVFVYLLVSIGGYFGYVTLQESRNKNSVKVPQNYSNNRERAVHQAELYFESSVYHMHSSQRLFLAYLQRKFTLAENLGSTKVPIDLYENPRTYPQEIHFLARMVDSNRLVNVLPAKDTEGIGITNIYSANCDRLPLPKNFWDLIRQHDAQGGYYLTHNALAFAFLRDNDCRVPEDMLVLKDQTFNKLAAIIDDTSASDDLRFEATAFLYLHNHGNLVPSAWLDEIVAKQTSNGGWKESATDANTSTHASLLAFWSLLEAARPDVTDDSLILRNLSK